MAKKRVLPSKPKRVKAIARERLGTVPAARPLDERQTRKQPKHKKPISPED